MVNNYIVTIVTTHLNLKALTLIVTIPFAVSPSRPFVPLCDDEFLPAPTPIFYGHFEAERIQNNHNESIATNLLNIKIFSLYRYENVQLLIHFYILK